MPVQRASNVYRYRKTLLPQTYAMTVCLQCASISIISTSVIPCPSVVLPWWGGMFHTLTIIGRNIFTYHPYRTVEQLPQWCCFLASLTWTIFCFDHVVCYSGTAHNRTPPVNTDCKSQKYKKCTSIYVFFIICRNSGCTWLSIYNFVITEF